MAESEPRIPNDKPLSYANEFGVSFSDHDCVIQFATAGMVQSQIALTHKSAKMLHKTLERITQNHEKELGVVIPFDSEKFEAMVGGKKKAKSSSD